MADPSDTSGPGGRVLLLAAVVAAVAALVWIARTAGAHGYPLMMPSANTLALAREASRIGLVAVILAWVVVELPWRRWGTLYPRALAWGWAAILSLSVWAWRGYQYNRHEIPHLWREPGAGPLPAALVDGSALLRNGAETAVGIALLLGSAWLFRRLLQIRFRPPHRWWSVVAGVLALGLAIVALLPASAGRPQPTAGDVILISLDAVRADRLGSYGNELGLTPNVDAVAAEGVRFDRAYCQEPWTLTSHMSMLTGLYPDAHGLDFGTTLAPAIWTLPERLRDAGYRTWGSVYDCYFLDGSLGYGRGFDHYEVNRLDAKERSHRAARWIFDDERPAFVFLHLYDPHSDWGELPYEAPQPFMDRFAPGASDGFAAWSGGLSASEALRLVNEGKRELPPELRERLQKLYDAGLAATDDGLAQLLGALRASPRWDDATIIILADHGEALGESGHYMHGRMVEETLRIPMIIKWPGGHAAGTSRDDIVETVDVMPTLLSAVGLLASLPSQGRDLREPSERNAALSRSGHAYALSTQDSLRIVYRWTLDSPDLIGLRRVQADGGDGPDILEDERMLADPWLDTMLRFRAANRALAAQYQQGATDPTAADHELLRSLGYVQ